MMSFSQHYRRDPQTAPLSQDTSCLAQLENRATGLKKFCSTHSGGSFEQGLYRVHGVSDMPKWTTIVEKAFPNFRQCILCFAYDWLGRQFALDFSRKESGQYLVLMMEPGTGQALEIPVNFKEFHDQELVEYRNEALAFDFYRSWLSSGGNAPSLSQCVGYKKPLFLGGEDTVANLELTDMEVYWSISGQLLAKIRGLPEGTSIGDMGISD